MTPYNPDDPIIARFLHALSLGESDHRANAQWLGVGGADLVGAPRRADGFPLWDGFGHPVSHAVGVFQFEPATWGQIAQAHQLDFARLSDQYAGAWYLAEQVVPTLYAMLQSGLYSVIQSRLARTWTSVNGNGATPGLSRVLSEQ